MKTQPGHPKVTSTRTRTWLLLASGALGVLALAMLAVTPTTVQATDTGQTAKTGQTSAPMTTLQTFDKRVGEKQVAKSTPAQGTNGESMAIDTGGATTATTVGIIAQTNPAFVKQMATLDTTTLTGTSPALAGSKSD